MNDVGPDPALVAAQVEAVRGRIADAGGDPGRVTIVAVTKGFGPGAVAAAVAAGVHDIAESYAQELVAKAAALGERSLPPFRWHFVGRLQTNKVRSVAPVVDLWQSIDRTALGAELARRAPGAAVLVQVNVGREPQKGGCDPDEVEGLVADLAGLGLDVRGLMGVPPAGDPGRARAGFRLIADLADRLDLPERSMGMTDDLELAVSEGATMVRVGRALFGPRPGPPGRPATVRD